MLIMLSFLVETTKSFPQTASNYSEQFLGRNKLLQNIKGVMVGAEDTLMLKLACVFWSVKEWLAFLRELACVEPERELEIDPRDLPFIELLGDCS